MTTFGRTDPIRSVSREGHSAKARIAELNVRAHGAKKTHDITSRTCPITSGTCPITSRCVNVFWRVLAHKNGSSVPTDCHY
ncbi:hypothetical protein [Portibacter lacus]|uniref:hypothetical protein n=1 Tax=Portibacter lacus TaxID=1099794 RepID=UPI001F1E5673|nr:hypothetical protein [Portibacter lacus]